MDFDQPRKKKLTTIAENHKDFDEFTNITRSES